MTLPPATVAQLDWAAAVQGHLYKALINAGVPDALVHDLMKVALQNAGAGENALLPLLLPPPQTP